MSTAIEPPAIEQPAEAAPAKGVRAGKHSARKQVRGSSLLFVGRLISMVTNFVTHVLIVRFLSRSDYGSFGVAQTTATMAQNLSTFGMQRAVSRYVPIYHERGEYGKLFGTVLAVFGVILGMGILIPAGVFIYRGEIAASVHDPLIASVLCILIFMIPLNETDDLLVSLFAIFSKPKAIFFRRYILAPGLRLTAVGMLIAANAGVHFLAWGYLVASAIGVTICGFVLYGQMRLSGITGQWSRKSLEFPWREVLAFALPLYSTDLVYTLMNSLNIYMLEYYGNAVDVAAYRAVLPAAKLNEIVFMTFAVLYTPQASRFYARNDREGINRLYWQTAIWIAVLTFPVFIFTFSLAQPLTSLVFGSKYSSSASILALLSLGYYVNAALGFNGTTLTIFRKVRYVSILNVVTGALSVLLNYLLIPRYGAQGAGVATCATLIIHNILKQGGLLLGTDVKVFDSHYLRVYAVIIASAAGLLLAQQYLGMHPFAGFGLGILVSLLLIRLNKRLLEVDATFPELRKIPGIALLLGKEHSDGGMDSQP